MVWGCTTRALDRCMKRGGGERRERQREKSTLTCQSSQAVSLTMCVNDVSSPKRTDILKNGNCGRRQREEVGVTKDGGDFLFRLATRKRTRESRGKERSGRRRGRRRW